MFTTFSNSVEIEQPQEIYRMAQSLYYSPRLDEKLISPLYHAAKARRIPMTRLASSLVREGLQRLGESANSESTFVREEPHQTPQPTQK